jgi:hypothetical protein
MQQEVLQREELVSRLLLLILVFLKAYLNASHLRCKSPQSIEF